MSDDIPVGSPPAPPGRHAAPGGWYADPARDGQERYWDGWNWTRNVRGAEHARRDAYAAAYDPEQPWLRPPGERGVASAEPHRRPDVPQWQQHQGRPPQGPPLQGGHQFRPHGGPRVPVTADGVPLASWGARVGATVLDWIVLNALVSIIGAVTGLNARIERVLSDYVEELMRAIGSGTNPDLQKMMTLLSSPELLWMSGLTIVMFVLYHGLLVGWRGASLGKMAAGLRVVPFGRGAKHRPSWPTAFWRAASVQLLGILPYVSVVLQPLDVLFPLWDRDRQALHDKLAKTQVVRTR